MLVSVQQRNTEIIEPSQEFLLTVTKIFAFCNKNNRKIIENHCGFSGYTNSCKNMFQVDINEAKVTYDTVMKRHLHSPFR